MKISPLILTALIIGTLATAGSTQAESPEIVLPNPVIQRVLASAGNKLTAIPYAPVQNPASVVVKVYPNVNYEGHAKAFDRIRDSFGGIYPYTVVKSNFNKRFVIISQNNDILIIGLPKPERQFIAEQVTTLFNTSYGIPIMIQSPMQPPTTVIEQYGRLNIDTSIPPGVPGDILIRKDLYPNKEEPYYTVNTKLANPITRSAKSGDTEFDVYQVVLK